VSRKSIEERFWEKVNKDGPIHPELGTSCWIWNAYKITGYGVLGNELAHRISWKIHHSSIPEGKRVLHRCDNPECTNPSHLFLGSQTDNMKDMIKKNRQNWNSPAKGESHGSKTKPECVPRGDRHSSKTKPECVPRGSVHWNSRLDEESVKEIRFFHRDKKISQKKLSEMFEIDSSVVSKVLNRKIWKHVE